MTANLAADTALEPADDARRGRQLRFLELGSPVPTYVGIAALVLGFALIALAWFRVSGESNVAYQLPYLASAGLAGLALVIVGVFVMDVSARRQDAAERARQAEQFAQLVRELTSAMEKSKRR